MTERLGQGRPDLFKKELQAVLRVIVWLALPVTVVAYFGRGYLVSFIKNGGDPTMAGILSILAVSILFQSTYYIAARSFYAQQDTRTPLYISIFTISLNIGLAIWFTAGLGLGVYGLALAATIVSVVELSILFVMMSRRIKGLFDAVFIHALARMASAAGFMTVVTYLAVLMFPLSTNDQSFFSTLPKFIIICCVSGGAYMLFSYMLRIEEVRPILTRLQKILFKRPRSLQ